MAFLSIFSTARSGTTVSDDNAQTVHTLDIVNIAGYVSCTVCRATLSCNPAVVINSGVDEATSRRRYDIGDFAVLHKGKNCREIVNRRVKSLAGIPSFIATV